MFRRSERVKGTRNAYWVIVDGVRRILVAHEVGKGVLPAGDIPAEAHVHRGETGTHSSGRNSQAHSDSEYHGFGREAF